MLKIINPFKHQSEVIITKFWWSSLMGPNVALDLCRTVVLWHATISIPMPVQYWHCNWRDSPFFGLLSLNRLLVCSAISGMDLDKLHPMTKLFTPCQLVSSYRKPVKRAVSRLRTYENKVAEIMQSSIRSPKISLAHWRSLVKLGVSSYINPFNLLSRIVCQ